MKLKERLSIFLLILLAGLLYFYQLGSFSLYDAAETTYGELIKQIRLSGDWITMHYNGEIIFDKPPLFFWLATIATYIFGFNEFSIRFWAALCGMFTVITTYYLGKSFYNQRIGFLSGIIVMTAFQLLIQSRIAELDILLTLLLTISFLTFWYGYQTKRPYFYWIFYLTMALATLTKGIIGIAFPVTAIFLFLLIKKELGRTKEMQIIPGIIIILIVAIPWYAAEWSLHGKKFTEFIFGFLFLSRFQGVVSGHPGPWYYYFLALLLGFAPWSHFLPFSLWRTWKNRFNSPELLTLCYIIPVFIVFSIAKTKLPNYVLPLYPFLALSVGKLWDDFLFLDQRPKTEDRRPLKLGMILSQILLILVVILLIIGFMLLGNINYPTQYQELIPQLTFLAEILIAGSLISIALFLTGQVFFRSYQLSFATLPITISVIVFILITQILPMVEKFKGAKPLGEEIAKVIKSDQVIAAYQVGNRPSVVFYSPKPVIFLSSEKEFSSFLRAKKGYGWITIEEYRRLKRDLPKRSKVLNKKGDLIVLY